MICVGAGPCCRGPGRLDAEREQIELQAVRLVGHADRMNGTGEGDYNQPISEKRVAAVRELLVRLGIDVKLIATDARGGSRQLSACEAGFKTRVALEACLLSNQRVEVRFEERVK